MELHTDFKKILKDFIAYFKDKGLEKFNNFLSTYKLNPSKSYASQITRECINGVCESFQWTKPHITYWKQDEEAKYYKVTALVAQVSMNRNDYSQSDEDMTSIERSARTLTYRPLNINHDHSKTLPFPENRVDWAEHEDNAVECVIRIHNSQAKVQRQIENGEIVNPSIEALPRGGTRTEDGRHVPKFWNFTALALLEKDETLPGVPTTFGIEPLFINEGMAECLVESLSLENKDEDGEMTNQIEYNVEDRAIRKEYFGADGLSICGQCKFFEILQASTTKTPSATGDTDAFNTATVGNFGLGVGKCKVLEKIRGTNYLVKHTDWGCAEGRLRDKPVVVNRGTQNAGLNETSEIDEVKTTSEIIELKRDKAELNEQLADKEKQIQAKREENAKLRHEAVDREEKITELEQSKSSDVNKVSRLTVDVSVLREALDKLKDIKADQDRDIKRKNKDIEYYKEQSDKYRKELNIIKDELADKKAELTRTYEKLSDATEKRELNAQGMRNAEEDKTRLQTEISELHIKLSEKIREISDYAKLNSDLAKARINDTEELIKTREEHSTIQEELKDTRRQLNKAKKRPTKVVVKT